jgi:Na+-transporting methylmalonyl-CoA/oxaloacetate decarboxylase gamma subunit
MTTSLRADTRRRRWSFPFLACLLVVFLFASTGWAAFGEDEEKPKPEFIRQGEQITAKLIPRGKRISVQIDFTVSGGKLESIEAMDFAEAERPEVDKKDFRSGLFAVNVDGLRPGAEIEVSMASNYFTGSTEFWVFNPKAATVWTKVEAEHASLPERVEALRVKVKDGGPLDSDGEVNGKIALICGPRDTFWGYAIGTLLIRFFGVFLVLAVLQVGMQVTSRIFRVLDKRAARAIVQAPSPVAAEPLEPEAEMASAANDAQTAAAIALALHLHLSHQRSAERLQLSFPEVSAWSLHGRGLIMGERFVVFDRTNRSETARFSR